MAIDEVGFCNLASIRRNIFCTGNILVQIIRNGKFTTNNLDDALLQHRDSHNAWLWRRYSTHLLGNDLR